MPSTRSAVYSLIFSAYFGCFYFGIGTLMTLAQHGDMGKFLGDFVITMIVVFAFLTFVMHELQGAFDKLNTPRHLDQDAGKEQGNDKEQGNNK